MTRNSSPSSILSGDMSRFTSTNAERQVLGDVTNTDSLCSETPATHQNTTLDRFVRTAGLSAPVPRFSSKRKSTEGPTNVDLDDVDIDGMHMDANCGQVRRKIRQVIDNGGM